VSYIHRSRENVKFALEQAQRGNRFITTLSLTSGLGGSGLSTPRPSCFIPEKDPVAIVWEAGWAPGLPWAGAENIAPCQGSIL